MTVLRRKPSRSFTTTRLNDSFEIIDTIKTKNWADPDFYIFSYLDEDTKCNTPKYTLLKRCTRGWCTMRRLKNKEKKC